MHTTLRLILLPLVVPLAAVLACQPATSTTPPASESTPAEPASDAAATCEAQGGKCTHQTATIACKSTPEAGCPADEFCCVM